MSTPRRISLMRLFDRSPDPIFVLSSARRLRYANPAWEQLTGQTLSRLRGTTVSATRTSASPLWRSLAPPPEVWTGKATTVRRAPPDREVGPPWWDVSFFPIPGESTPTGVIARVAVVGEIVQRGEYQESAAIATLRHDHARFYSYELLAGISPGSERLLARARVAAATTHPVWIVGDPGSGKETLARILHHQGPTAERPFLAIDAVALEPYLIEGLLHGKGGLLNDASGIGTLYVARPENLPRDVQDRLARGFLRARSPSPRLICGSAHSSANNMAAGRLIPPFHTQLSVVELRIPPLKQRLVDLPAYLDRISHRYDLGTAGSPSDEVLRILGRHDWPRNVRELEEVWVKAVRAAGNGPVRPEHLPRMLREQDLIARDPRPAAGPKWTLDQALEAAERRLIELALRDAGGSLTAAAERLGIARTRLSRRIEALGISLSSANSDR